MRQLTATGLAKTYPAAPAPALAGVTFAAPPGALVVVTGRSGSGKTTLLNCLTGLDQPDAGTVFFGDLEVTALLGDALAQFRRDHVGFVFQSFGLLPELTARENVGLPLRLQRVAPLEREERVGELLDLVGLGSHQNQRPGELSGGEQQRVAIARALVARPELLVADEPTGQLDSVTGRQIIQLLRDVTRASGTEFGTMTGTTTLIATHDERLITKADLHLHLVDGKLVDDKL